MRCPGFFKTHVMQDAEITWDVANVATNHVKARMSWLATREAQGPSGKRRGLVQQHHKPVLETYNDKRGHGRYTHDQVVLGERLCAYS